MNSEVAFTGISNVSTTASRSERSKLDEGREKDVGRKGGRARQRSRTMDGTSEFDGRRGPGQ